MLGSGGSGASSHTVRSVPWPQQPGRALTANRINRSPECACSQEKLTQSECQDEEDYGKRHGPYVPHPQKLKRFRKVAYGLSLCQGKGPAPRDRKHCYGDNERTESNSCDG